MKNYRNLTVWQAAHALVMSVYKATKTFPKEEQYNLISQLRRAATSVPTNIAEGCGKLSQKDFAKYLQTALGSLQEVEYLTFLSCELRYITEEEFQRLDQTLNDVKAKLINLVTKVRKDDASNNKKS